MPDNEKPALSILIVDDDPGKQLLLIARLRGMKGWDLTFDITSDGEAALKRLQTTSYDLVLLDYRLPGENGLAVLEKIRQHHAGSAVVMVTMAGNEQLAVSAMKRGALDYVSGEDLADLDLDALFRRILQTRTLIHQNMELRQVNQMKNEFIANVSHELRTPLTVIIGFARSMQEGTLGPLTAQQGTALEAILGRSESLLGTLNQILRLRDAYEGRQQLLLRPTPLRDLVTLQTDLARKDLAPKQQSLEVNLPAGEIWVLADAERLGNVLANLLSNASKFGPEGSAISVTLRAEEDQARICVRDEGSGVPPEMLPHLFEKFASSTQQGPTRQHPGLGLGLALSKQVMESHRGRIWLESQAGKGCAAWMALPLASKDRADIVVDQVQALQKKRILIVEDNPDLVDVLMLFMSTLSANFEMSTARSGFEALDKIKDSLPDLIILDVMMPGMDGFEVISRLKRVPETQAIPILVLTGYSDAVEKAKKIGATDVLLKPFERDAFLLTVLKLLRSETPQ